MDYERKYQLALERAKKLYEQGTITESLGYVFPELQEDKDERIRKWLEELIEAMPDNSIEFKELKRIDVLHWLEKQGKPELKESEDDRIIRCLLNYFNHVRYNGLDLKDTDVDEVIAWLEKQGEQKPYGQRKQCSYCQFNYAGKCKGSCQMKMDEQKHADKAEPKFHPGDWITNGHNTWKIVEIKTLDYILQSQDGNIVDDTISYVDEYFHLWTIKDAKNSDVLCYHVSATTFFLIGIFKRVAHKDELWGGTYRNYAQYGGYGSIENYTLQVALGNDELHHCGSIACPATKEQCDLLFQKMRETGYEWDSEKKELKKIKIKKKGDKNE